MATMFLFNNNTNDTIDKVLEEKLGPQHRTLFNIVPLTVIYVIIFITGLLGNISTCVVLAIDKYSTTNTCLFNLAVSDLLLLIVGLPQETFTFWQAYPWIFGEIFCIARVLMSETSTYVSILTITVFTVERYLAICYPMLVRSVSGLKREMKIIATVWIISGLSSLPIGLQYSLVYVKDQYGRDIEKSVTCNISADNYRVHYFLLSTVLFFLIPIVFIIFLYLRIGIVIKRSASTSKSGFNDGDDKDFIDNKRAKSRLAALKILVAVVVAFILCWVPFHTQRLLNIFQVQMDELSSGLLFYASGIFYYFSAVVNPLLYGIMSAKYRRNFVYTLTLIGLKCSQKSLNQLSANSIRHQGTTVRKGLSFHGSTNTSFKNVNIPIQHLEKHKIEETMNA